MSALSDTREMYRKEKVRLAALPDDLECCACGHGLGNHEGARDVPQEADWYTSTPEQECDRCSCTFYEEPNQVPVKKMTPKKEPTMPRTQYVKLSQDDWRDIKDTATNVTGYNPEQSSIKGKTTVDIMHETTTQMDDAINEISQGGDLVAAENILVDVRRTLRLLKARESYNRVIGKEKKEKMAAALSAQQASA